MESTNLISWINGRYIGLLSFAQVIIKTAMIRDKPMTNINLFSLVRYLLIVSLLDIDTTLYWVSSYNALLSGDKLLAKIARNEASQLFSVRLSNLLYCFFS
jgi:hypothetical protein